MEAEADSKTDTEAKLEPLLSLEDATAPEAAEEDCGCQLSFEDLMAGKELAEHCLQDDPLAGLPALDPITDEAKPAEEEDCGCPIAAAAAAASPHPE